MFKVCNNFLNDPCPDPFPLITYFNILLGKSLSRRDCSVDLLVGKTYLYADPISNHTVLQNLSLVIIERFSDLS